VLNSDFSATINTAGDANADRFAAIPAILSPSAGKPFSAPAVAKNAIPAIRNVRDSAPLTFKKPTIAPSTTKIVPRFGIPKSPASIR